MGLFNKIFGNYSEKEVKRLLPIQSKVLELDEQYQKLTDSELKNKAFYIL